MTSERLEYVHLPAGSALPNLQVEPRRTLVLIGQEVEPSWRDEVSQWIVDSGCLYMMAWGTGCSTWECCVDFAMLRKFDDVEVPDEHFIMTTSHEKEPLCEVFFYARMCAFHPTISLPVLTILDITAEPRDLALRALHLAEKSGLLEDVPEQPRHLAFRERLKMLFGKL